MSLSPFRFSGSTPVTYDNGNNRSSANPVIFARGNGNIYRDGTNQYEYDALNRIHDASRLSDGLQTALYSYDALGRGVTKTVFNGGLSGTITNAGYRYLYDGDQIIEELIGTTAPPTLRQFVWGQYIDELVQLMTYADTGTQPLPPGSYYPLQDSLYRTTALTDSDGGIVEAYDYDAYGNTLIFYKPGTGEPWFTQYDVATLQPACEYLFTGRQYDPETEIFWSRARYYAPWLGRFLGRDNRALYDGTNLYEYVKSSPTSYLDPTGMLQISLQQPTTRPTSKPTTSPATKPVPRLRPRQPSRLPRPGEPHFDPALRPDPWRCVYKVTFLPPGCELVANPNLCITEEGAVSICIGCYNIGDSGTCPSADDAKDEFLVSVILGEATHICDEIKLKSEAGGVCSFCPCRIPGQPIP